MHFLRITTNYTNYLKQFYHARPKLKEQPYAVQYRTLVEDGFGWADFWTHALKPFGYEVWEPVANARPMQMAWAQEHGVGYARPTWQTDIVAKQIEYFQPEILFADDVWAFQPDFLRMLRQQCRSIRLILGWCAPADVDNTFEAHDLILSNVSAIVTHLRDKGHCAEHIEHAFEPRILKTIRKPDEEKIPFSFIGSIFSESFHNERDFFVRTLLETTSLQIWSNVYDILRPHIRCLERLFRLSARFPALNDRLVELPLLRRYARVCRHPYRAFYAHPHIAQKIHAPVFGRQMFQMLRQSCVTLNHHGDRRWDAACNMRLFEATGMGTCLLTDWKANLPELFEPDSEVVTYRSVEECQEKVKWLLNHPAKAAEIARAGQVRTLREHTFAHRAAQLHNIILKNI